MKKGEKLSNQIIGIGEPIEFEGAEKLRDIVKWLDYRPENLNFGKSHLQLIAEYNKENTVN